MNDSLASPAFPKILNVLVIGANGYLGASICRAFLRTCSPPTQSPSCFRVYGLVRRESAAHHLAMSEINPIVGSLSDRDVVHSAVLSHSRVWDIIVTCTEPSRDTEAEHWDELLGLIQGLSKESASRGVRPFVLWSSGCKDYGMTGLHGDRNLTPHTEESPLQPHPIIRGRMNAALRVLEVAGAQGSGFDATVVRATPVFGYSGSYYGAAFDYAAAFSGAYQGNKHGLKDQTLDFKADAGTIMHGLHVDDCGEAYAVLAITALWGGPGLDGLEGGRQSVAGKVFNISGRRYETLSEVGAALAQEYGFGHGARFGVSQKELPEAVSGHNCDLVFGWSQWVSSERIRELTDWCDKRPLFSENTRIYRVAYEAAAEAGLDDVEKVRRRMAGNWEDDRKTVGYYRTT
ncbi:hypothetical protein QBC36DRAFT_298909 [Triangularia setosa]|uniref:NAD-dependent epimerase/dehydratase domain-containing protein n=1 Tax=Triangularia setosa TaxID=2587417 RepID=A0AAN7A9D3_9PEZI|nr:hypothetical protein QBC36DRAFT_298909 [Podospora setosa]